MSTCNQQNRPLQIFTPLPENAVVIEKLTGTEGISELFQFELDLLLQPNLLPDTPYLAFEKLLGQPVSVQITGWTKRFVHGIIARLSEGTPLVGRGDVPLIRCRALLVPKLWLLTRRSFCRVFEATSVKKILETYLKGIWGLTHDMRGLKDEAYPPRNLCIQYQETDFDFLCRLMEEEGIRYYFTHTKSDHTLVLRDDPLAHPPFPPENGDRISYANVLGGNRDAAVITDWSKSQVIEPMTYWVRDFSLHDSQKLLSTSASLPDKVEIGPIAHKMKLEAVRKAEVLDPQAGFASRFEADAEAVGKMLDESKRVSKIRAEQGACRSLAIDGAGDATQMLPGRWFTLAGLESANGHYLITRIEHSADDTGVYSRPNEETPLFLYGNRFRCLPKDLPYRPPTTQRETPILYPITATVVGVGKTPADNYGRVKVKFHWPTAHGGDGGESTCWLWVAQAWAGKQYGSFFIPRAGNEVIVSFLNGQRDRPVITGCVHDNQNLPPFWDPVTQGVPPTVSGIRSKTVDGTDTDYSEISIDDAKDHQLLKIVANHDASIRTKNDHEMVIGYGGWGLPAPDGSLQIAEDVGKGVLGMFAPYHRLFIYANQYELSVPSYSEIRFGGHGSVVIDPQNFLVNRFLGYGGLLIAGARLVAGQTTHSSGKSEVLYGDDTRLAIGSRSKSICHGAVIQSVLSDRVGTGLDPKTLLMGVHLAALGCSALFPALRAQATSAKGVEFHRKGEAIARAATALAEGFLKFFESRSQQASFGESLLMGIGAANSLASQFTSTDPNITLHGAGVAAALGVYMKKLVAESEWITSTGKAGGILHQGIEDTYGITCGEMQFVSSGDVAITAPHGTVCTTAKEVFTASKSHSIAANEVELRAFPSTLTMSSTSIVLEAGPTSKIEVEAAPPKITFTCGGSILAMDGTTITMTCGGSTLVIDPAQIHRMTQRITDEAVSVATTP